MVMVDISLVYCVNMGSWCNILDDL